MSATPIEQGQGPNNERTRLKPGVEHLGSLPTGKDVIRLQGLNPQEYGFLMVDQGTTVIPLDTAAAIPGVNQVLNSLGYEPVDAFPSLFLLSPPVPDGDDVENAKKAKPFTVADAATALKRTEHTPLERDLSGRKRLAEVQLEPELKLVAYEDGLAIQNGQGLLQPNYRRVSTSPVSAATLTEHLPSLADIDKKRRDTYAKEIWRRVLEAGLPEDMKRYSHRIAGITRHESMEHTMQLEEWVIMLMNRGPEGHWGDIYSTILARMQSGKPSKGDTPPHMGLTDEADKVRYNAAVELRRTQDAAYSKVSKQRRESGLEIDGMRVEYTVTPDEVNAVLRTSGESTAPKKEKQDAEPTVRPEKANLGLTIVREDIESTMGPFTVYPEYRTQYPPTVTEGLAQLYGEYNRAFGTIVEANREWGTDYQFATHGPDSSPVNTFVQVDMVGLPDDFLQQAAAMSVEEVQERLRGGIFEIENSMAMYQLLERIFSSDTEESQYKQRYRATLDAIRARHQMPIAVLATTQAKYEALRTTEFGKQPGDPLPDEEVMRLSGFDRLFGPDEFIEHLNGNGGESGYLLYVRSSDPVAKLRDPNVHVDNPLLSDPDIRRAIKAHSLTFNVDDPELPAGDERRINDTKAYLPTMGMAYPVFSAEDTDKPEFRAFLTSRGMDPAEVEAGRTTVRTKPLQSSYGCYGHERGRFGNQAFRKTLATNLEQRGPYVVQPEMPIPAIDNEADGCEYVYIDRNFLSTVDGVNYTFMGGFRSLMPRSSVEAKQGRIHGSSDTVWAEIT